MPNLIGKSLGKYHIVELLGQGGMAQVYKAAQIDLARYVAVKVFRDNDELDDEKTLLNLERFEREAIAAGNLSHPNIVPIYDFGREGDLYYMAMALIQGPTLKAELLQRRAESRSFSLAEITEMFQALTGAVDYAHSQGIIHRDLKPANIMLTPGGQVMLTDFGIARLIRVPRNTLPGTIIGTPAYMSPEQVNGQSGDSRSDIYALGVILYELVTGQVPFTIKYFQDVLQHIHGTVSPPSLLKPDTPKAVEWAILKALHKEPDQRFQTAGELAQALVNAKQAPLPAQTAPPHTTRQDWGEAPDVSIFYGRQAELGQLKRWVAADHCRLVGLMGLGGMGKTTLVTKLARTLATLAHIPPGSGPEQSSVHWGEPEGSFDTIIWRSLQNAPRLDDIVSECLQILSRRTESDTDDSVAQKISRLIEAFRRRRCLLVLDNFETILDAGHQAGYYQAGYEPYGEFLKRVGETQHQSCLILTSREKPKEFARLEGENRPVRSLQLKGLTQNEGQALLKDKSLTGKEVAWANLVNRYSGNPLALQLVSETIREVFDGEIDNFLREDGLVFGGVRDILAQQFERLLPLEREIVVWLAIEREAISRDTLQKNFVRFFPKRDFIEALQSLSRRSIIEKNPSGFTLQNVVMEYSIDWLVGQVCREIATQSVSVLGTYALLKAQAKDYVRKSQVRLILKPVIEQLQANLGRKGLEDKLQNILAALRRPQPPNPDYAAGNILNLLVRLKSDLRQFDFSKLTVRQAYLQNANLQRANFVETEFSGAMFTETFGRILSLAFSPDGTHLAAGTATGEVRIWQAKTGQPVLTCRGHSNWVQSIAFSPDGRLLASGSTDRTIRLWDAAGNSEHCLQILSGHSKSIRAIAFSPDGRLLASASIDQTVRLWDTTDSSGNSFKTLSDHTDRVQAVAFGPIDHLVASGSRDQTVRIWDVNTGQCLYTLSDHSGQILSVAFSPNGRLMASSSSDQTVRLWDVNTGQCLQTLLGHTDEVQSVAVSPDGRLLASGSTDRTVRLWAISTGQCLYTLRGHAAWILSVAFSPDGHTLASGSFDQNVRLWEVSSGRCLRTLQGFSDWISAVAFNSSGKTLASGGYDGLVRIWDMQHSPRQGLYTLAGHTRWLSSVAFSPDGRMLASGSADRTIRLWDTSGPTGQNQQTLRGHRGWVWSVAFSPDGRTLASGSEDQTVQLWDVNTGQRLQILANHSGRVRSVAFSPNGKILASGSDDRTVQLWLAGTGQGLYVLEGHTDWIMSVAFSADGRTLASGSADRTVRLWDVETLECMLTLEDHADRVRSVCFSPAGNLLASADEDQRVRLWDINSGELLQTLAGHTEVIKSVVFNVDGDLLASTGDDGTIRLWEVQTGTCLETMRSDRPYEQMDITGATGLTEAQKMTLKALGATGFSLFLNEQPDMSF